MSIIHDQHDGNSSLVTLHKDSQDVVDAVVVPDINDAIIESGVVSHSEVGVHTMAGPSIQTHPLRIEQINRLNQSVQHFQTNQNHHQENGIFSEEDDDILDDDEEEEVEEHNSTREKNTSSTPMTLLPSFGLSYSQSPQVMLSNQQVSHMPVQMNMRMVPPIFIPQGITGPLPPIPGMPGMNGMVVISDHNHLPLMHAIQEMDNAQIHMMEHDNHKSNRKARWRPTQEQRTILENFWRNDAYPDQATKQQILTQLGPGNVTYKQVTSWFKHKRENDKQKGQFQYKFSPTQKFNPDQNQALEALFNEEPYAKGKTLENIAVQIGVPLKRVQNWFKHKRSRLAHQGKFNYKPRNLLNFDQITFLRGAYSVNQSPCQELCEELASELKVTPEQVSRWFSNQRSRKRKRGNHCQVNEDSDGAPAPRQRETSKKRKKNKNSSAAGSNLIPASPTPQEDVPNQSNDHSILDQSQNIHDGISNSTSDQILLHLSHGIETDQSDPKTFGENM